MDIATLTQILEIAFKKKVSDIHFEVDNPPMSIQVHQRQRCAVDIDFV